MASKEMAEKKQSKNVKDMNSQMNGVMIRVYVESPTIRSRKQFKGPRAAGAERCDRRAQLLAYARHLRNAGPEEVQLPRKESRQKSKKCIWFQMCSPSARMARRSNSRWRYDRMDFKENKELHRSRKRKDSGKSNSPVLGKLKNMLKKLSCKEIKV